MGNEKDEAYHAAETAERQTNFEATSAKQFVPNWLYRTGSLFKRHNQEHTQKVPSPTTGRSPYPPVAGFGWRGGEGIV